MTSGRRDPRYHVRVGDDEPRRHDEARPFLDHPASLPGHLHGGPLGPLHRGAGGRVGRQRHRRRGLRRKAREDDGEAVLCQKALDPGEHGGDGREHVVEGAHDARLLQRPVECCVLAVLYQDRHHPRDDECHRHRHGDTEGRVDGPETQAMQQHTRARPQQPAQTSHHGGHTDEDDQGEKCLGGAVVGQPRHDGGEKRPEDEAEQEPSEGQHLHGRPEPEPVDARQRHDGEQHVVDPVHRRHPSPPAARVTRTCDGATSWRRRRRVNAGAQLIKEQDRAPRAGGRRGRDRRITRRHRGRRQRPDRGRRLPRLHPRRGPHRHPEPAPGGGARRGPPPRCRPCCGWRTNCTSR